MLWAKFGRYSPRIGSWRVAANRSDWTLTLEDYGTATQAITRDGDKIMIDGEQGVATCKLKKQVKTPQRSSQTPPP
jgi:hypothetical protein